MSFEISYYFEHPEKFPLPQLLENLSAPCEILNAAKQKLESILNGKHENNGEMMSGDTHFHGSYYVGKGTVIYDDVTIIGPAYIGENCEIMSGAIIRPYTIIGDKCNVGHGSELKRCIMYSGAKVASLSFVGDSVLGASARIGSGVITANRKFDQSNATLKLEGKKLDLGDSFFGLILGDSSRLGANSVTQPGTHIGPHTWVYPMTNVRGFIPREKRVYHPRDVVMEDNEIIELKP